MRERSGDGGGGGDVISFFVARKLQHQSIDRSSWRSDKLCQIAEPFWKRMISVKWEIHSDTEKGTQKWNAAEERHVHKRDFVVRRARSTAPIGTSSWHASFRSPLSSPLGRSSSSLY